MQLQTFDVYTPDQYMKLVEDAVEKKTQEQKEQNTALIEKIDAASQLILACAEQVQSLREDNIILKRKIENLTHENAQFKNEIRLHLNHINRQQEQYKEAQENLKRKDDQIAELQKNLENIEKEFEEEKQNLSRVNTDFARQNGELHKVLEALIEEKTTLRNQKQQQQEEIDNLRRDLNEAQSLHAQLEKDKNNYRLENFQRARTIFEQTLRCNAIQTQVISLTTELTQEREEHAQAREEHNQATERLNSTRDELAQSNRTLLEAQADYERLEARLNNLLETHVNREELENANERINALTQGIENKEREIRELMTGLSTLNPKNLEAFDRWITSCTEVFGLNADEQRNLKSNLSKLLSKPGFFAWQNLLSKGIFFTLGGAMVHCIPLVISLLSKLIK
ncbi:hypothetical protein [Candidatus Protochlamydia amoebophila]|uniref:Uncharacterized protein n=1 Tax=Candidatus Protochlamydia amoebophila TaxID=362787 RepID=A0A0C1JIE6_9BACT|nr:hypothetical protein [Candidatus Protochlamydia amoebophila]KIC71160.1 hypothetical protein DB44_EO00100 [Candidatus Protochlamydia amoebophila]